MRRILLTFALALVAVLPASAQQLKLSFNGGRVSVDATSVPVRTILTEWAKLGGTTVIGSERITGAPLTIKLDNVPEAQALEIVLRSVAGYMAAPRRASAIAGASMYDRILVLATSAAPPATASRPTPTPNQGNANQRFAPPRPPVMQPDDIEPSEEPDPNPPNPPVFSFPQPGQQNGQPGVFQGAPPSINGQPIIINPNTGAPQTITISPASPGTAPSFGAPSPGMIVAPAVPNQPGTIVRPPGGG
jgi:hypothetical protein